MGGLGLIQCVLVWWGEGMGGPKVECDRAGQKNSGTVSIEEGEQFVLGGMIVVEMGWVICQKVMKSKVVY